MAVGPLALIQAELDEVKNQMERDMRLRAGHVSRWVELPMEPLDQVLHAAVLILAARALGGRGRRVISMASVVQFIHMATHVHQQTTEDPAFPVLVGDYLYTKFFSYLCEHDALNWLAPLAHAICRIHEGGIRRLEALAQATPTQADLLKVVELESASLLAEACAIGAQLAGAAGPLVAALRDFGRNLGVVWGINKEPHWNLPASPYLARARESLYLLPDSLPRQRLLELLQMLEPVGVRPSGAAVG